MKKVLILVLVIFIAGLAACTPQSEGPSTGIGETVQAKGATLASKA